MLFRALAILAITSGAVAGELKIVSWDAARESNDVAAKCLAKFRPHVFVVTRLHAPGGQALAARLESRHQVMYEWVTSRKKGRETSSSTIIFDPKKVKLSDQKDALNFSVSPAGGHMLTVLISPVVKGAFLPTRLAVCTMTSPRGADRLAQAVRIREWASQHKEPVVIAGAFSFQLDPISFLGDQALQELTRDRSVKWMRPLSLVMRSKHAGELLHSLVFVGGDRAKVAPALRLNDFDGPEGGLQLVGILTLKKPRSTKLVLGQVRTKIEKAEAVVEARPNLGTKPSVRRALESLEEAVKELETALRKDG